MFSISSTAIDPTELRLKLGDRRAGAFVTFEGWVRDHNEGKEVLTLEYEAYEALCENEAKQILSEAKEKFGVIDVHCVHRTGELKICELAVWVGVSSAHRGAAFDACRYVIDEIKSRLPIWKKETYTNGTSGWVNCQSHCGHASIGSEKHSDQKSIESETHSGHAAIESATHSDHAAIESETHSGLATIESETHSGLATIESATHSDQKAIESETHSGLASIKPEAVSA